jgi:hypothetical protein
MKPGFLLAPLLANLLGGLAAPSAHAGLTGKSVENSGGVSVTIHDPSSPLANAMGNIVTLTGSQTTYINNGTTTTTYQTYCVDLYHYTNSSYVAVQEIANTNTFATNTSSNYTNSPDTPNTAYGQAGLGRAAWLVNMFANHAGVDRAALQIAIWKAEYETNLSDYDKLSAGIITFSGLSTAVQADAKSYLDQSWTAGGGQFASSTAYVWFSFTKGGNYTQDQIAAAVPEPAGLAIAGLGAIGFGFHALCRRRGSRS